MLIKLAYAGVVLIWTTTPLAIKWTGEGINYVLGATARMSIGCLCLLLVMLLIRQPLVFHRKARQTYLAASAHLYLGLLVTYWSAQYLPSGWMSVIFGLNPFLTAILAAIFLKEASLGWRKVSSYLLGVAGLVVMFMSALDLSQQALLGMLGVLLATFLQGGSAVWVKRINAGLSPLQLLTGGLFYSLPMYVLTWYVLTDAQLPAVIPSDKTLYAILYLGIIATTLGFTWYYYILKHLPATQVAMLSLMTPLLSLLLGHTINHEPLSLKVALGTGLILTALLLNQLAERRQKTI
ncbi:DMT family transporter [Methylomonas sp. AM2-LC]|uniref:DMT family transporter n=1 Tax=Methylomonas sp. AM2-LC TaxID=3153301 RepID=UPI00326634DB